MRRRKMLAVLSGIGATAVSGCTGNGDGDDTQSSETEGPADMPTATEEPTEAPTETPTATAESTTQTAEPTVTETDTPTPTPAAQGVASAISDSFEDGEYSQDPTWFENVDARDGELNVIESDGPDGSSALLMRGNRGTVQIESGRQLRFDAPWTMDLVFQSEVSVRSSLRVEFGSGSSGLFGPSTDFRLNIDLGSDGDDTQRRATVSLSGSVIDDANDIEQLLQVGTWYRVRVRHDGEGSYELRFREASTPESEATVTPGRGSVPETSADNQLPIRIIAGSPNDLGIPNMEYLVDSFSYVTDAASE